jgi:3-oxoacyl-[acyl-carrier protein] reductase
MGAIMAELAERHGGIDVLINNAGLHSHEYSRSIAEMGLAKTRRLLEVNVVGPLICTLAAWPFMKGRDNASIVNISSSGAYMPGAYVHTPILITFHTHQTLSTFPFFTLYSHIIYQQPYSLF